MSPYRICLIITIVVAIVMAVIQVAAMHKRLSAWPCIVCFVLFFVMVLVTSYFKGQEVPLCPVCETRVETNYCPDCGTDMRADGRFK